MTCVFWLLVFGGAVECTFLGGLSHSLGGWFLKRGETCVLCLYTDPKIRTQHTRTFGIYIDLIGIKSRPTRKTKSGRYAFFYYLKAILQ